jgi:hypothetical protein
MSAQLLEPLHPAIAEVLPSDTPLASTTTVTITAGPDGPIASPASLSVGAFAGVIQLTIDDTLPDLRFLNGFAFVPSSSSGLLPPPSVMPDQGVRTLTLSWLNKLPHNSNDLYTYRVYLVDPTDGTLKTVDPTVENGPVG